jgi:hypothetical protein
MECGGRVERGERWKVDERGRKLRSGIRKM